MRNNPRWESKAATASWCELRAAEETPSTVFIGPEGSAALGLISALLRGPIGKGVTDNGLQSGVHTHVHILTGQTLQGCVCRCQGVIRVTLRQKLIINRSVVLRSVGGWGAREAELTI